MRAGAECRTRHTEGGGGHRWIMRHAPGMQVRPTKRRNCATGARCSLMTSAWWLDPFSPRFMTLAFRKTGADNRSAYLT